LVFLIRDVRLKSPEGPRATLKRNSKLFTRQQADITIRCVLYQIKTKPSDHPVMQTNL